MNTSPAKKPPAVRKDAFRTAGGFFWAILQRRAEIPAASAFSGEKDYAISSCGIRFMTRMSSGPTIRQATASPAATLSMLSGSGKMGA